ncbi:MAG: helix-turn-helix domain-containing protein [Chloroflexota bacterium]|nr:helix-turn-helix domain-containing protein [Chloroflexota bacterium]
MQDSLSTKDAAERLGVTPQHLRRLIESGQLPAERVGRQYVVDSASLEALRAAREAVAQIPPDALVQITYLRNMLAQIPWEAIQQAQRAVQQFESSGLADAVQTAQRADAPMASALPDRIRWQQWAGSDDPRDAVAKLEERARQRTRGTASGNSTEMLRAMREGRHADV